MSAGARLEFIWFEGGERWLSAPWGATRLASGPCAFANDGSGDKNAAATVQNCCSARSYCRLSTRNISEPTTAETEVVANTFFSPTQTTIKRR